MKASQLQTKYVGRKVFHFKSVASTQETLRSHLSQDLPEGSIVLAEIQTAGRGRQANSWISLPGKHIYMSILLRPSLPLVRFPLINIAVGAAVCTALEDLGVSRPKLKWPNDVLLNGRKVCGILSEVSSGGSKDHQILLGIGLNIEGEEQDLPPPIHLTGTTLRSFLPEVKPPDVLAALLNQIEIWYENVLAGKVELIREEFSKRWIYGGQPIWISQDRGSLLGIADEIDDDGALLLLDSHHKTHRILSGEVLSLRPSI